MLGQVHLVPQVLPTWEGGKVHSRNEIQEAGKWLIGVVPHVAELYHHLLLKPVIND